MILWRRCSILLACEILAGFAVPSLLHAQQTVIVTSSLPQVSREEYLQQLVNMQSLVAACSRDTSRCDPKAVAADEEVGPEGFAQKDGFTVKWYWLREALDEARDPKSEDRKEALVQAANRLAEDAAATAATAAPDDSQRIQQARTGIDDILSHAEFRRVHRSSYMAQKLALLGLFIDKLFTSAGRFIPHSPWIGVALEWGLLAAAAIGLILWAWRQRKQQKIGIAVQRAPASLWQAESDDWAAKAKLEAQRGHWRDAVHCLYWSAIVMLEGQRLWRQNRARTPREYVVLLEPGSPRRRALGGLTRVFERIWYGLRPATAHDYESAQALLEELRAQ